MRQPVYDPEAVRPMWEELLAVGVQSLTAADEVETFITKSEGTSLMIINSICGCAAGSARPGVMLALQNKLIPDNLGTVFAGMDHEAVDKARSFMTVPPSSPCMAIFENGQMVYVLQRHQIEGATRDQVANNLIEAFNRFCRKTGPSVSPEEFENISPVTKCGSKIPRYAE